MADRMYEEAKARVVEIYRAYLSQGGDAAQTAEAINEAIEGITAVRFNAGKRFTISNHHFSVSLPYNGGRRRRERPIFALAYAGYLRAQQNGSRQPGEVHISRRMSTKDHTEGLETLVA